MAKYYVQSGNFRMVVHAESSRAAAIWAVHRSLGQTLPFLTDDYRSLALPNDGMAQLGEALQTSELGFDRDDAGVFDSLDIMSEWLRLVRALKRLQADVCGDTVGV